jgi:hypothetical protein
MSKLSGLAEANAAALTLEIMLGVKPVVRTISVSGKTQYLVRYEGNDKAIASEKLNQLVLAWRRSAPAKEGCVRYDLGDVVTPVIWKQYWWMLALGAFAGAGIYYLGHRKGRKALV